MADKSKDGNKKKGGGGRTTALAGLLAVVAVIAAWLSNCIPGFGIGADGSADGSADGEAEQATPAKPESEDEVTEPEPEPKTDGKDEGKAGEQPAAEAAPTGPHQISIDARGCFTTPEATPRDCTELCESGELSDGRKIMINPADAPHAMVTSLLDCLKAKNPELEVAISRDE